MAHRPRHIAWVSAPAKAHYRDVEPAKVLSRRQLPSAPTDLAVTGPGFEAHGHNATSTANRKLIPLRGTLYLLTSNCDSISMASAS